MRSQPPANSTPRAERRGAALQARHGEVVERAAGERGARVHRRRHELLVDVDRIQVPAAREERSRVTGRAHGIAARHREPHAAPLLAAADVAHVHLARVVIVGREAARKENEPVDRGGAELEATQPQRPPEDAGGVVADVGLERDHVGHATTEDDHIGERRGSASPERILVRLVRRAGFEVADVHRCREGRPVSAW